MPDVCMCFQVHSPLRLRPFKLFDLGTHAPYLDLEGSLAELDRLGENCFRPANAFFEGLIKARQGDFSLGMVISGVALELMETHRPALLTSFQDLVATGKVELMIQSRHYSLSFLHDRDVFAEQLQAHATQVERLFGQRPRVVAPVAGLYSNPMGYLVHKLGYRGLLVATPGHELGTHPHQLLHPVHVPDMALMVPDSELNNAVEHHFADPHFHAHPLTAETFTHWIQARTGGLVHLFWDYRLLGEVYSAGSGIFDFFRALPEAVHRLGGGQFVSPQDFIQSQRPQAACDIAQFQVRAPHFFHNSMQQEALSSLFKLKEALAQPQHAHLRDRWQHLQAADHLERMSPAKVGVEEATNTYARVMHMISDLQLGLAAPQTRV